RDAREARTMIARDGPRMLLELARCLGVSAGGPEVSATVQGDVIRLETETGLHVEGRWLKAARPNTARVSLVVGRADDRRAAVLDSPARFDLTMRAEALTASSTNPPWAFAMLNRLPLGMWVRDAMAAGRWLRGQGFEVELIGAGDAGALIAL